MKNIYFLFALLPFSLFAEVTYPDDFHIIESNLIEIKDFTSQIETCSQQSVTHLQYIRTMTYEILTLLDSADLGVQLSDIRTKLNGISNRAQTIIDKLNEFLPEIKSNLESANTTLFSIQTEISYLDDRLETFQSEVNQLLQSIDYKLTDIQSAITDGFENLNTVMSSLQESITTISTKFDELNTITQNIYTELLSQGYDIQAIRSLLYTTKTFGGSEKFMQIFSPIDSIGLPNLRQSSWWSLTYTNILESIFSIQYRSESMLSGISYSLGNHLYRMYDIQTNFYSSIKIQKDISTNVAYIASVITNSHDLLELIASNVVKIARHTMPTNVADQYETQQEKQIEQISSSYQEHEGDMSSYESSLTHIPSKLQEPLDDGVDYIDRLSSSDFEVSELEDDIYAALPDYHSSLANMSFSLPITISLTPDIKQILSILRKCVTTTIWVVTFLFSLFMIQKFLQFVQWIMSLLQPTTRDVFGNISSGSLYRVMGG